MSLGLVSIISFTPLYRFNITSFMIAAILGHFANLYYHFGVELVPKWFFSYYPTKLILTASFHEVHHIDPRYNFGLYFTYWDRIFKTIKPNYDSDFAKHWETPTSTSNNVNNRNQHSTSKVKSK